VTRFIQRLREIIGRLTGAQTQGWSDAQVFDLVRQTMRVGDRAVLGGEVARSMAAALASRSPATQTAYEDRIDALFAGAKATAGTRVLDRSDVMGLLGYPEVPMMLNESHLRAGLTDHPEMTAAMWKKVPGWLENPAAVYLGEQGRNTGRLQVIAPETVAGYPVIMAVEPNPNPAGSKPAPAAPTESLLVTVYAKTTGGLPSASRMVTVGEMLYVDTKNAPEIWRRGGGQFPKQAALSQGRRRILTEKQLAGYRRANPALSTRPEDAQGQLEAAERKAMSAATTSRLEQGRRNLVFGEFEHEYDAYGGVDGKRIPFNEDEPDASLEAIHAAADAFMDANPLRTLEDIDRMGTHGQAAEAAKAWLDAMGVESDGGSGYGESGYIFVPGPRDAEGDRSDEGLKLRFANHRNQSGWHANTDWNWVQGDNAEGALREMLDAALRFSRGETGLGEVVLYSVRPADEALDFTASGKALPTTLIGSLGKVRSPEQLQQQATSFIDRLNTAIHDGLIPVKRWTESLPVDDTLKEQIISGLYRGDGVRNALMKEAEEKFGNDILKGVRAIAQKHKMDIETAQQLVGFWLTADYVPNANDWLLQKDTTALNVAQASGDAAAIAKAQDQLDARDSVVHDPNTRNVTRSVGVAGGLNNAQARLMKANIEARIPRAEIEPIAQKVYDLLAWKKDLDIRTGKVSAEQAAAWPNYRNYVPLTGSPFADPDIDVFGTGTSIPNVSRDKALNGRTESVAEDGLIATWGSLAKSATHAGYQDFKRGLNTAYEQALAANDGNVRAAQEQLGLSRETETGLVRTGDQVVIYRDGGRSFVFRFDNQAVIDSLKRQNMEDMNAALRMIQIPTRIFARMATQLNPMFAPMNWWRDVWEKSELIRTRKATDAQGRAVNMNAVARRAIALQFSPELWKANMRKAFGKASDNSQTADYLDEMLSLGGLSTWGTVFARARGDLVADIRKQSLGAQTPIRTTVNAIEKTLAGWSDGFEMMSGLGAYPALREAGVDAKQAAAITLDLTNFRKRGANMAPVRALYAFAQPMVMGGANFAASLKTPTGRRRLLAYTILGTLVYASLRAMGDDDEAGEKIDNLSNFTLERSIPIPIGDGKVFKLPLGFGMAQYAWNLAVNIVKAGAGEISWGDALAEVVIKQNVKTFSPIQPNEIPFHKYPMEHMLLALTPTLAKPLTQVAMNRGAFGNEIRPGYMTNAKEYFSEQGRDTTAQEYHELAREVRQISGIDMTPEQVRTVIQGWQPGVLRFAMDYLVENPNKERQGKPTRTPLISQFVEPYNPWGITGKYYEAREAAQDVLRRQNVGERLSADDRKELAWLEADQKLENRFRTRKGHVTRELNRGGITQAEAQRQYDAIAKEKGRAQADAIYQWRKMHDLPATRTKP
jgi:hypothetical protein